MALSIEFLDRNSSSLAPYTPNLDYTVTGFSVDADGGPKALTIQAKGSREALQQLKNILRYGVKVVNERGDLRWWGFIHSVMIDDGAISYGWSLERMSNRVAIGYTISSGGRETTGWAINADSVTKYGKKELLSTVNDVDGVTATAMATTILNRVGNPVKSATLSGSDSDLIATIECKGWYETLDWIYCDDQDGTLFRGQVGDNATAPTLAYAYEPENGTLDFGTSSIVYVAIPVTFTGNQSYDFVSIRAKVVKIGSPSNNLRVDLMTDSGTAPLTSIAQVSILPANVQTSHYWQEFTFNPKVPIVGGVRYWLRFRADGSVNNSNYYRIATNTTPAYSGGFARYHNGSTYVTSSQYPLFSCTVESNSGFHIDIGGSSARQKVARSLSITYPYSVTSLSVNLTVQKCGTPSDNLVVEIASSVGGAAIHSATIAGTTLTGDKETKTFSFSSVGLVGPTATIYVRVSRSGAVDNVNFYKVFLDDSAPTDGGTLQAYDGSVWSAFSGDLVFSITFGGETTQQIKALATTAGQFFAGIDLDVNSGVYTPVDQTRDTTVLKRFEDLLDVGTNAGLSILTEVTSEKRLRIYTEPTAVTHYIKRDGTLLTAMNVVLMPDECPVAILATTADVDIPDFTLFIQEARYDANKAKATFVSRDTDGLFDIGGITQG